MVPCPVQLIQGLLSEQSPITQGDTNKMATFWGRGDPFLKVHHRNAGMEALGEYGCYI